MQSVRGSSGYVVTLTDLNGCCQLVAHTQSYELNNNKTMIPSSSWKNFISNLLSMSFTGYTSHDIIY